MAKVTIGTTDYIVEELNFLAVQKAWASIMICLQQRDPMSAIGAAVEVIAAGLQEQDDFKRENFGILEEEVLTDEEQDVRVTRFLKKQLKAGQIQNVQVALDEIIEEAGLRPKEGELAAMLLDQMANRGTETSIPSSLDSLPQDAREETGTV